MDKIRKQPGYEVPCQDAQYIDEIMNRRKYREILKAKEPDEDSGLEEKVLKFGINQK